MSALIRHRFILSITALVLIPLTLAANTMTLLDPVATRQQQAIMHTDISTLIHQTNRIKEDSNSHLHSLARYFNNRPYLFSGAQGEGQACDSTHLAHCPHLQQDPLVRTDGFNCTTYVQTLLALYYAHTLPQFFQRIRQINYHHFSTYHPVVDFFHRNHFVSKDLNPTLHELKLTHDASSQLAKITPLTTITTTIEPTHWLQSLLQRPHPFLRVYRRADAQLLQQQLNTDAIPPPSTFKTTPVSIQAIPLSAFFQAHTTTPYSHPNTALLNAIPTPAIAEIVRNDRHWTVHQRLIRDVLHTGIAVSHLGLLYRHTFRNHELIYQHTQCNHSPRTHSMQCDSHPRYCHAKQGCSILLFTQATSAFPGNATLHKQPQLGWGCSTAPNQPHQTLARPCNRVTTTPLIAYLRSQRDHHYLYLNNPAIAGIHIEALAPRNASHH